MGESLNDPEIDAMVDALPDDYSWEYLPEEVMQFARGALDAYRDEQERREFEMQVMHTPRRRVKRQPETKTEIVTAADGEPIIRVLETESWDGDWANSPDVDLAIMAMEDAADGVMPSGLIPPTHDEEFPIPGGLSIYDDSPEGDAWWAGAKAGRERALAGRVQVGWYDTRDGSVYEMGEHEDPATMAEYLATRRPVWLDGPDAGPEQ